MKKLFLIPLLTLSANSAFAQMMLTGDGTNMAFKSGASTVATITPTGNITAATPTANNHLATKEYVDSKLASAGGGGKPRFAGVTENTYMSGGGLHSMDQYCDGEFPGSHFARSSELNHIPDLYSQYPDDTKAVYHCTDIERIDPTQPIYACKISILKEPTSTSANVHGWDCNGWTSTSSSSEAITTVKKSVGAGYLYNDYPQKCHNALKLICTY